MAHLLAVDWGTTSFRAYLLDEAGIIRWRTEAGEGILSVTDGAFERHLEAQLHGLSGLASIRAIIAAGMITSRQGWCETPYLPCPCGPPDLADNLLKFESDRLGMIWFVPGVSQSFPEADVMRGEETQLAGLPDDTEAVAILPGTHSKWVEVKGRRISRFKTFMTGELFAIVMTHSILRVFAGGVWDDETFRRAVRQGFSAARDGEGPLSGLFRVRAEVLLDLAGQEQVPSRVSGLLIGSEIAEALRSGFGTGRPYLVIGAARLLALYRQALAECGIEAEVVPEDVAASGLYRIAQYRKLI